MNLSNHINIAPFSLERKDKRHFLISELNELMIFHQNNSREYYNILKSYGILDKKYNKLEDFPYLPVRIFKDYELKSCNDADIIKTLTSSGTTSQKVSKIYIDKETSSLQTKVLVKITQDFLGKKRLPMLIIDTESVFKNPKEFSARGAGIMGLSTFGRDHTYALNHDMSINFDAITDFLNKYRNEKVFIFGFTYMIWKYFYTPLKDSRIKFDLSAAILMHSGGWKKLIHESVDNRTFKDKFKKLFNLEHIHNFYGMVEQVGSIYIECEQDHLHASIFSDIIIRDTMSLQPLNHLHEGLVETVSVLPKSYPGHSLLTEDLGTILGEDDCPCGRKGKYFTISGRLPQAEIRGCSDVYEFIQTPNR